MATRLLYAILRFVATCLPLTREACRLRGRQRDRQHTLLLLDRERSARRGIDLQLERFLALQAGAHDVAVIATDPEGANRPRR
jgi:hypothetical protein